MLNNYQKLKRIKGERFAQIIRDHHNGLLEIPDLDKRLRYAGNEAEPLLSYLMKLKYKLQNSEGTPIETSKSPYELLKQVGYHSFYADNLKKQNDPEFMSYYAHGEELCTFNDKTRHERHHIIHAFKENAKDIKRQDFRGKEERQDLYGTSVISIQIAKHSPFISIKNRYNHTVNACDDTFNSNPDNIIPGLTHSLRKEFNVDFDVQDNTLPENYIVIDDHIIQCREIGNIRYGDGVWVKDGVLEKIDQTRGEALFDHYKFNPKTKKLEAIPSIMDSFPQDFNRDYKTVKDRLFVKKGNLYLKAETSNEEDTLLIGARNSRIETLHLNRLTTTGLFCLASINTLTHFEANILTSMGDWGLLNADKLTTVHVPLLKKYPSRHLKNKIMQEKNSDKGQKTYDLKYI